MSIKECSERLCYLLTQSSYRDEASEINFLVNKILISKKDADDRVMTINKLISRCHPKWLGDYYITGMSYSEWTDLISLFKKQLSSV